MSKKLKILVSVLVAVVLLLAGTATVMARDGDATLTRETGAKATPATGVKPQIELSRSFGDVSDNVTKSLLGRVAEILGIPQENLVNAFKQAQQEMRQEAFTRAVEKAVEKGLITQDEANAIEDWWKQKPEALNRLSPRAFGFPALRGGHMRGGRGQW